MFGMRYQINIKVILALGRKYAIANYIVKYDNIM